jgi:protein-disulfide isomerase
MLSQDQAQAKRNKMHFTKLLKITVNLAALVAIMPNANAQANPSRQPIARVGDQPVYEEDLFSTVGAQLWQIKNQEYDLKSKALVSVVNQRLLEIEAKSKGIASADALLEQMVDRNVPPPTDSEIEAYYLAQKSQINRPLSEVKTQVEQALLQARRQEARANYVDQLRQKTGVAILLDRPRMDVKPDPARMLGSADAPVTIVEFGDFQCPYCQAVQPSIKELMDKYRGKVRLGFRDFPLRQIHPQAQQSAEAAHCAGDQGKFWEYHDLLYNNQSRLDVNSLKERAATAGLDAERFQVCLDSGKFRTVIDSDLQSGSIAGITGTPTFFINGVILTGAQPVSAFADIIDSELKRTESRKSLP